MIVSNRKTNNRTPRTIVGLFTLLALSPATALAHGEGLASLFLGFSAMSVLAFFFCVFVLFVVVFRTVRRR